MRRLVAFIAIVTTLVLQQPSQAQVASPEARAIVPKGEFPTHVLMQFNLSNLWVAKTTVDGKAIRLVQPNFRMEKAGQLTVKKMRSETRTRTNVKGEAEAYTVAVPYEETVETAKSVPDGNLRYVVPLTELKAFRLDGTPLPVDQLAKILSSPKHVFASIYFPAGFKGLDPYFRSVFNNDVLLLELPESIESQYKEAASENR